MKVLAIIYSKIFHNMTKEDRNKIAHGVIGAIVIYMTPKARKKKEKRGLYLWKRNCIIMNYQVII